MEVVTLASWKRAGSLKSFDTRKAFYAVLVSINNHTQFAIVLEVLLNYDPSMIERR